MLGYDQPLSVFQLVSLEGAPVATVKIPDGVDSSMDYTLDVHILLNPDPTLKTEEVQSDVVDITLIDTSVGVDVTKLDEDIEICLSNGNSTNKKNDLCLGYYDTLSNTWVCEDECLEENEVGEFCGKTDHLTSFALLLGSDSNGGGGGGCDSSGQTFDIYTWLSLSFAACACCIVLLVCLIFEIRFRRKSYLARKKMTETMRHLSELQGSGSTSNANASVSSGSLQQL